MDFNKYNTSFDIDKFLERSQESEKQRLEQELDQIRTQLENRKELHEETVEELETKQDWYVERLNKLYTRGIGKQGERQNLKNRIEQIYRSIREEKRNHWLDCSKLRKEKREIQRSIDEIKEDLWKELL